MLPIQAILWPTDASEPSMIALETAIELAENFKAKLYALQVVNQLPSIPEAGYPTATIYTGFDVSKYEKQLLKSSQEILNKIVEQKVPKTVQVETHVELGTAEKVIVNYAREKNVGLIVMATHGRTGVAHLMLGSIAAKTIRNSTVPVLAIPIRPTGK